MKTISKFLLVVLVLVGLLAAFDDAAAAWSTRAKIRCNRGVVANIHIILTLNGANIGETDLSCANGGSDSVQIQTRQKPNDWHIEGSVNGTPCSSSGFSFPARVRCTTSPTGATVQIGHSREVGGI